MANKLVSDMYKVFVRKEKQHSRKVGSKMIYKCECGYMYKESGYCSECGKKLEQIDKQEYDKVFNGNCRRK